MNFSDKTTRLKKLFFNIYRAEFEVWLKQDLLCRALNSDEISIKTDREDTESVIDDCISIAALAGFRELTEDEGSAIDEIIFAIRNEISKGSLKTSADEIGVISALITDLVVASATSTEKSSKDQIFEFAEKLVKRYPRAHEPLKRAQSMLDDRTDEARPIHNKFLSGGGGIGLLN